MKRILTALILFPLILICAPFALFAIKRHQEMCGEEDDI